MSKRTKKNEKFSVTQKELYNLYVVQKKTTYEIGKIFGFSNTTIGKRLKEFKIKARRAEDNFKYMKFIGKDNFNYIDIPKNELVNLYLNKKMNTYQLAKKYACHNSTISEKLKKLGITVVNRRYKNGFPICVDCSHKTASYGAIRCDSCNRKLRSGKNHPMFGTHYFVGERSHFYVDGRTPLHKLIRELGECEHWRKSVFERDNYRCQECLVRGGKLEAHHKIPFANLLTEFLKEYDQFSPIEDKETLVRLAIKYKPFWDINNGQTLCDACHNEFRKSTLAEIRQDKRRKKE